MHVAGAALIALAVVIAAGAFRPGVNPGLLAVALAVLVGGLGTGVSGNDVLGFFPTDLFMPLAGVTFLFALAEENGTLDNLMARAVRLASRRAGFFPAAVFVFVSLVSMAGPGNIAATALAAPPALALAGRLGLGAFPMTLLIVGAANGAAFSPLAPTGVLSNALIARMAPTPGLMAADALAWKILLNSLLVQGAVSVAGFLLFGGGAWLRGRAAARSNAGPELPTPAAFNRGQWTTLVVLGLLVAAVVVPGLPAVRRVLPPGAANIFSGVGPAAFLLAGALTLLGAADARAAVRHMPWDTLMMVCGMAVLIRVLEKAGGMDVLLGAVASLSGPVSATFWLALLTGLLSVFSSSSGVVMPLFLPLVSGLARDLGGDPAAYISAINIGSHLVDSSPLSTVGALCLAGAAAHEDKGRLFRRTFLWGAAMSVVGAGLCWLLFGLGGL